MMTGFWLLLSIALMFVVLYLNYDFIRDVFFTPPYIEYSIAAVIRLVVCMGFFELLCFGGFAGGVCAFYFFNYGIKSIKNKTYKDFWNECGKTMADFEKDYEANKREKI